VYVASLLTEVFEMVDTRRSVPQLSSVGRLAISIDGFKTFHKSFGKFPPLLEMVRTFGTRVNNDPNPVPAIQTFSDDSDNSFCLFDPAKNVSDS
jgi:hypothetical protein